MPLARILYGSIALQKTGQLTPTNISSPLNTARCTMTTAGRSFSLTHLIVGEIVAINGQVQRLTSTEGSCATLPQD
jgi:hypothetical protein